MDIIFTGESGSLSIGPIEWATILISISALALSVYQAMKAREHNRLSVKPYLRIVWKITDDFHGVGIKNLGLGPAMISNFGAKKDSTTYSMNSLRKQLDISAHEKGVARPEIYTTHLSDNSVILSGETIYVFRTDDKDLTRAKAELFWDTLKGCHFEISYHSFYNEGRETVSKLIDGRVDRVLAGWSPEVSPANHD